MIEVEPFHEDEDKPKRALAERIADVLGAPIGGPS